MPRSENTHTEAPLHFVHLIEAQAQPAVPKFPEFQIAPQTKQKQDQLASRSFTFRWPNLAAPTDDPENTYGLAKKRAKNSREITSVVGN